MAGGLDFNGASGGGDQRPRYDLDQLANALASTADSWVPLVFPRGRISDDKTELRLANIKGAAPRNTGSCVVSLTGDRAGSFFDYDGGASGGPLATLKEATGLAGRALFDRAAELSHYRGDANQPRWNRPAPKAVDHTSEITHILARSKPAAGTLAETYLVSRKLAVPASADLRFCQNVTDYKSGMGRPAMIGLVRGADGAPTGGIHRTFLAYDGAGKAAVDKPKKMLGPIQHGAVRLFPVGGEGVLGVAEGIETAIAAATISGLPVWACLAAGNLGGYDKAGAWTGFEVPLDVPVRHLVIFADRGAAGEGAAQLLADRVGKTGMPVDIQLPDGADDFNGDLLGVADGGNHVSHETKVPDKGQVWSDSATPQKPEPDAQPSPIATGAEDVNAAIRALTKDSPEAKIKSVLRLIINAGAGPIAFSQLLNQVRERTKVPAQALKTSLRDLYRDSPQPPPASGDRAAPSQDWMRDIILLESGEPKALLENAATALERAPDWKDVIWLDEFSERIMLRKPPPWHDEADEFTERPWTDNDDFMATRWLQRAGIHVPTAIAHEAVLVAGFRNPYHPVREYLDSLRWDGTPRLDLWTHEHLGTEDTAYTRAVGARWMISAVARVMRPGIKVDHMLILEGPQERGKSTALRALFDPWFSDGMSELGSKDAAIELAGVWLIEFAELDAMRRVERNRLKAFITRAADRYRPPWGRHAIDHPRQMVFAGSVNDETYLDDPTGGRRFWPVKIGVIRIETLWQARDQLWAEAAFRFDAGEKFYLHEADLKADAMQQQTLRQIEDAWHTRIRKFLEGEEDNTFPKDSVTVAMTLAGIHLSIDKWDRVAQNRVIAYFTAQKWERRVQEGSGDVWYYRPR